MELPLNILDLGVEERHANGHARSSRYSLKGLVGVGANN
jgi:hypothetical protein